MDDLVEATPVEKRLKHDRTTTVVVGRLGGQSVVVKRYNPRNQWHRFKRAFRMSRARRCWDMSQSFSAAGLNVAKPVMMVEKRFGPIRGDAFFVSEALDGHELLTRLPEMGSQERMQVKHAITHAFDVFHQHRISHGDLKATNLLWVENQLYFIDLDAAQKHGSWSLTWDRSHRKDRLRFMKNWQDNPELTELFSDLI